MLVSPKKVVWLCRFETLTSMQVNQLSQLRVLLTMEITCTLLISSSYTHGLDHPREAQGITTRLLICISSFISAWQSFRGKEVSLRIVIFNVKSVEDYVFESNHIV